MSLFLILKGYILVETYYSNQKITIFNTKLKAALLEFWPPGGRTAKQAHRQPLCSDSFQIYQESRFSFAD